MEFYTVWGPLQSLFAATPGCSLPRPSHGAALELGRDLAESMVELTDGRQGE